MYSRDTGLNLKFIFVQLSESIENRAALQLRWPPFGFAYKYTFCLFELESRTYTSGRCFFFSLIIFESGAININNTMHLSSRELLIKPLNIPL